MPEYDETAETTDEQSTVATAAGDESVEAASEPEFAMTEPAPEEDFDPVAELRQKLRYAPGDWYVVHSYAGYENKVKTNLETRITSLDMEDYIYQVECRPGKRSRSRTASAPRCRPRSSPATSSCGWS